MDKNKKITVDDVLEFIDDCTPYDYSLIEEKVTDKSGLYPEIMMQKIRKQLREISSHVDNALEETFKYNNEPL